MKVNGVSYHISTVGNGSRKIVLLHGFTGTGENFHELISCFEQQEEFTFILVDLLGHGKSDSPTNSRRFTIQHSVYDLKRILDNLKVKKISLYGYSMGGRVALSFSLWYPDYIEKLVLESASPGIKLQGEREARVKADDSLADRIEREGLEAFVRFWTNIPLFSSQNRLPAQKQQRIYEQRMKNSPFGLANSLRGLGTGRQPSYWGELSKVTTPTLLTAGEYDEKFVEIAREMNKSMKKSQFVKISGAGHAIHVEQPRKFGKIVSEFLTD